MDNIFLPRPKDKWFVRHNKLNEVVSTDDKILSAVHSKNYKDIANEWKK
jgi:hypothetical protein